MAIRNPLRVVFASALVLTGCSALIGVNDIFLDPNAGNGNGEGGSEASTSDGTVGEGGTDAAACNGDLQTDKQNCGRCGHDCLGGNCATGKCEVIALASGLATPGSIAIDATHVYFANAGDGTVARIQKTGGTVERLVSGGSVVDGVAVSGAALFWSSNTFGADAGGGGGVWRCSLPACTDKKAVSTLGFARHLEAKSGYVYYGTQRDIRRVKDDGTGDMTIDQVNQAFAVAVDATHVYYTSNQNNVRRSLIGGGGGEDVGPLFASIVGFVTVDSDHFYWAYSDLADKGVVLGALKAAPATRTPYGNANIHPIAITSDGTNVYWANDGTTSNGTDSNGDGELLTCPIAGCTGDPVRLADKLHFGGPIVIDATALYFVEFGGRTGTKGRILKIAKP